MNRVKVESTGPAEFDLTLDEGTEAQWNVLAIRELQSGKCYCGATKRTMQTFCRAEYYALPPAMRHALYARIGAGYKEAYLAARECLFDRAKGGER